MGRIPDSIGATRDAKRGRGLTLSRCPDPQATLPGRSIPPSRSVLFNAIFSRMGRGPAKNPARADLLTLLPNPRGPHGDRPGKAEDRRRFSLVRHSGLAARLQDALELAELAGLQFQRPLIEPTDPFGIMLLAKVERYAAAPPDEQDLEPAVGCRIRERSQDGSGHHGVSEIKSKYAFIKS
jgi:hypothetical protein